MRPTPTLLRLAVCLSSLSPIVSAWPNWLPELDSLIVRQNDDESPASTTESAASETASATESATATETEEDSGSLNTAKPKTSTDEDEDNKTETETGTKTKNKEPKKTSFDQNDYPGGIKVLTPDPMKTATALYKIGDFVTLGWNYTSVQAEPTAVDVLLSCSAKSETWTLTANMTYETKVAYVWDTKDQADDSENPLGTDMYTLIVKDSEAELSDLPEPGYLGVATAATFGLYTPMPYTPLPEWECVACNAATGGFDTQVIRLAFTMTFMTVMSFTWFTTGLTL